MSLKIGVALFVYNRPEHTQKTLEALRNNYEKPEMLFMFHDGLKDESNGDEWENVDAIIQEVNWCDVQIVTSTYNKGLANSIIDGVNHVFGAGYDAVIVLEDDCVTSRLFLTYMYAALEKYKDNDRVFAINGYEWPIENIPNDYCAHFIGRAGSWGWGQWKNRWEYYNRDYLLLNKVKSDPHKNELFKLWGEDLQNYLYGNIEGKCDSWTVFWALECINREAVCLTPNVSLVNNIGFDGTGVHCVSSDMIQKFSENTEKIEMLLPESTEILDEYKRAYRGVFKNTLRYVKMDYYNRVLNTLSQILVYRKNVSWYWKENNIKSVAIWGVTNYTKMLIDYFSESITVKCIIESAPLRNSYHGIHVVGPRDIHDDVDRIIVVPGYDAETIYDCVDGIVKEKMIPIDELLGLLKE